MASDSKGFSLIGKTPRHVIGNVLGLLVIGGVLAAKFIDFKVEHVSTVSIPTADYALRSQDDVRRGISAFKFDESAVAAAASRVQSTPSDVQQAVAVTFVVGEPATLALECTSAWPQEKVEAVCAAFADDIKRHLKQAAPAS